MTIDSVATTSPSPTLRNNVLIVVSNPSPVAARRDRALSGADLTHPYYELKQSGVEVTIASPHGGKVRIDERRTPHGSPPRSCEDVITIGVAHTSALIALLQNTPKLADLDLDRYDGIIIVSGLGPTFTIHDNAQIQRALRHFYEHDKPAFVVPDVRPTRGQQTEPGRKVAQILIEALEDRIW